MNMPRSNAPKRAMIFAAGRGTRLRPLTDKLAKPLVEVAGRTILDRILDRCASAGVEQAVVNTHYLADQVAAHVAKRKKPAIVISREDELLETGGGVAWLGVLCDAYGSPGGNYSYGYSGTLDGNFNWDGNQASDPAAVVIIGSSRGIVEAPSSTAL